MRCKTRYASSLVALTVALAIAATSAFAKPPKPVPEAQWLTDFAKAKEVAGASKKPILINFSGSDWCGWCQKLDSEVFTKEAFKEYAKKDLVLFNADFPQRTKLPETLQQQNQALAKQYGVRGFPTIVLLDSQGKQIAQTGYQPGGPEKYVQHLQQLLTKAGK